MSWGQHHVFQGKGKLSDFRPQWVDTFEDKDNDQGREDLQAVVDALAVVDGDLMAFLSDGTLTLDQAEMVHGEPFTGTLQAVLLGWDG